jgi:hypothetical protein
MNSPPVHFNKKNRFWHLVLGVGIGGSTGLYI